MIEWSVIDTWIIVVGVLSAVGCALPGAYLLLRRQSMMGDAISHSVLPGIAGAYLIVGNREPLTLLAGAIVIGILTTVLIRLVKHGGQVEGGAAMGVVFTALFALGLVMIRRAADHVDLDPDCVLYGAIELTFLDTVPLLGMDVPRAALLTGGMLLANLVFLTLFHKELKLSSFDPGLSDALGYSSRLLHHVLMVVIAATMVASFEAVGSILVIAMLIVPPACAYLLCDRLVPMLLLSAAFAAASAVLGHLSAITVPTLFGQEDTSTAGMMALMAGVLFTAVFLGSPKAGVVARSWHRLQLGARLLSEEILGLLYRRSEAGEAAAPLMFSREEARRAGQSRLALWLARQRLRRKGFAHFTPGGMLLTERGLHEARRLVRAHRLWETWLVEEMNLRPDHVHGPARRLESITGESIEEQLARETAGRTRDPHDRTIPPSSDV